ncbi:hypothetical protein F5X96DRAFT_667881 [Biscogniauxia mediterranea]|nr:hypothetical protein F5X96DRAFT_667881 [Biscogniauxia mediterranea]
MARADPPAARPELRAVDLVYQVEFPPEDIQGMDLTRFTTDAETIDAAGTKPPRGFDHAEGPDQRGDHPVRKHAEVAAQRGDQAEDQARERGPAVDALRTYFGTHLNEADRDAIKGTGSEIVSGGSGSAIG